jgi:hypothetical protein
MFDVKLYETADNSAPKAASPVYSAAFSTAYISG